MALFLSEDDMDDDWLPGANWSQMKPEPDPLWRIGTRAVVVFAIVAGLLMLAGVL